MRSSLCTRRNKQRATISTLLVQQLRYFESEGGGNAGFALSFEGGVLGCERADRVMVYGGVGRFFGARCWCNCSVCSFLSAGSVGKRLAIIKRCTGRQL